MIIIEQLLNHYIATNNFPKEINLMIKYYFLSKKAYITKLFDEKYSNDLLISELENLQKELLKVEKIENYHSLYIRYNSEKKTMYYYISEDYLPKFMSQDLNSNKKKYLDDELFILFNNELLNINCNLEIAKIFNEIEACNIYSMDNKKYRVVIDKESKSFVYCRHASLFNSEVLSYAELLFKFMNKKDYYLNKNNEDWYKKWINSNIVIPENLTKVLLFDGTSPYDIIMKYLLHIKYRYNVENNLKYHEDLSKILEFNFKKRAGIINNYILNSNY